MEIFYTLLVAACLAFIPAKIASNKGYSFGTWWLYGFLIFIVALIHSLCLKKKEGVEGNDELSTPDLLLKYKELLDKGIIKQEEFEKKKQEIIN